MAILHDEKRKDSTADYACTGGYGYGGAHWYNCRVTFHEEFHKANLRAANPTREFFYKLKNGQDIKGIMSVLNEVEEKLKLGQDDQLQLWSVDDAKSMPVYRIAASEWWFDAVRFTLLTCLIRECRGTLEKTITEGKSAYEYNGNYLKATEEAVRAFVDGATFYHGEKYNGWCNTFQKLSKPLVENLLKKEPSEKKTVSACYHLGWPYYDLPLMKR